MLEGRFKIIFERLDEATGDVSSSTEIPVTELEEISELCRLAAEMRDPEPDTYTTT